MSQFQPMKNPKIIILEVLLEIILDEVYGIIVNVLLKLHSNSCFGNIQLSDDVWEMILINFELLPQFYLLMNDFPI